MNNCEMIGMLPKGGSYVCDMSRRVYSPYAACPTLPTKGGGGEKN